MSRFSIKSKATSKSVTYVASTASVNRPTQLKSKYGDLSVSEHKRINEIELENSKIKGMHAILAMENDALRNLLEKTVETTERRTAECWIASERSIPVTDVCWAVGLLTNSRNNRITSSGLWLFYFMVVDLI